MATIPHVSPDTLIEAAAQNAFIDEVNNQCAKRTGGTITGTYAFTNSAPAFSLRRTGEAPFFQFQTVAGTRMGFIQGEPSRLTFATDGTLHRWLIGDVQKMSLDSAGALAIVGSLTALGAVLGRADDTAQLWLVDRAGSGVTGHAFIAFHPSGTASATGTRGGFVGFNGQGLELQSEIGDLTVQASNGDVTIDATGDNVWALGGLFAVGNVRSTTPSLANPGIYLYSNGYATATTRNTIASTVDVAGGRNVYLRHNGAASVDGGKFVEFFNSAGSSLGSITQQGSGIRVNGDTRITLLEDKIAALEAKIATLEARLPAA